MSTICIVDDKEMLRDSVGVTLQRAGFTIMAASSGAMALNTIARRRPDAVVTDLKMPGMTGVELLEKIREFDEDLPVILMTAYGAVDTAVRAMKLGAFNYITKPFEGDELVVSVKRAIEHARLKRDNEVLRRSIAPRAPVGGPDGSPVLGLDRLVGESEVVQRLKEEIIAIAASHGTALLHGESGAGKEVVARAIHDLSPRVEAPFLALNCAALSESLLESELFGHEKGAFTGADQLRKGRFELADGGTLLLDEISEVSRKTQAKLLRTLQERSFERVGSSMTMGVDVRVIATTNRDLEREIVDGRFRQDLYYRLNVLPIFIPPLRDRRGDVPLLAEHFVREICAREGGEPRRLSGAAIELLHHYDWPGNVRELQNICERAVVLTRDAVIGADLIRGWLGGPVVVVRPGLTPMAPASNGFEPRLASNGREFPPQANGATAPGAIMVGGVRPLEEIERQAIIEALDHFRGHRQRTATALGIGVRTLGLKLKKWKEQRLVSPTL